MNPNVLACFALLSQLKQLGVTHAVISPGSRSTPLAYVANELFDCTVVIDERDAGFAALGISESMDNPAVVITTSGSAPTHLYPSVVEAFHSRIPIIIISSDRPYELRGIGAPQTIDQENLYGTAVRYFCDAQCPHDVQDESYWLNIASSLIRNSRGLDGTPGPVQLNIGMREPLCPEGDEHAEFEALLDILTSDSNENISYQGSRNRTRSHDSKKSKSPINREVTQILENSKKGCITIGRNGSLSSSDVEQLVQGTNCIVLCDAISNLRDIEGVITSYDAVLRRDDYKDFIPDVVIQIGDPLTSKIWNEVIASSQVISINPIEDGLDPHRTIDHRIIESDVTSILLVLVNMQKDTDLYFKRNWKKADGLSLEIVDELATLKPKSEPALFLELGNMLKGIQASISILVASSMPIRYIEWFWNKTSKSSTIYSHRGTNGIDGMLSSTYGIAYGSEQPTLCVLGDVAFAHDVGFLTRCSQLTNDNNVCVIFFVVDNGGGAIFRHLEQAKNQTLLGSYERILRTDPRLDIEAISNACRSSYFHSDISRCVSKTQELLENGIVGTHVIHLKVDHESGPDFMQVYREKLALLTE